MTKTEPEKNQQETISFENAFARLEAILERMNSGTISLDESLKLYEEADALINICSTRLTTAEKKIEILITKRNGELLLGADQKPQVQEFEQGTKKQFKDSF